MATRAGEKSRRFLAELLRQHTILRTPVAGSRRLQTCATGRTRGMGTLRGVRLFLRSVSGFVRFRFLAALGMTLRSPRLLPVLEISKRGFNCHLQRVTDTCFV